MTKKRNADLTWQFLKLLPPAIRGILIRQFLTIQKELPEGTVIKVAENFDELKQAFQIAQQAYKDIGIHRDSDGEYRITKYHILPTTSVIVLKINEEVIATLSVVVDSALGLPIEELFNIAEVRANSPRIAEVSTLAIKKGYRRHKGLYLFPMFKYLLQFSRNILGVHTFVIATHPRAKDFYQHLYGFKSLEKGLVKNYEFVNGAPALGQYMDVKNSPKNLTKLFRWHPLESNLGHYTYNYVDPRAQFPDQADLSVPLLGKPILTPEQIEFFFIGKNKILDGLNEKDIRTIANLYAGTSHKAKIEKVAATTAGVDRREFRYIVNCMGLLNTSENDITEFSVLNVSSSGLRIFMPPNHRIRSVNQFIKFSLNLPNNTKILLHGISVWANIQPHQMAIKLINPPIEYSNFIMELDAIYRNAFREPLKKSM